MTGASRDTADDLLPDHDPRLVRFAPPGDLTNPRLVQGGGTTPLEVLLLDGAARATALREAWRAWNGNRPAPLLAVALDGDAAILCGTAAETLDTYPMDRAQAGRVLRRALDEPDRNAALRYLREALPASRTDTDLPGFRNEGLLTDHVLRRHAEGAEGLAEAIAKGRAAAGRRDADLLAALGFGIERLNSTTSVLTAEGSRRAVAVLLTPTELEEASSDRFGGASPIAAALDQADRQNLPWVVTVQADRVRLYPRELGIGVGRRGRTDTYLDCRTDLIRGDQVALLHLAFSAEALREGGTLDRLLADSKRFAAALADRLRDRIYDDVVPRLATAIATARGTTAPTPDDLRLTYAMALTTLFRLLFVAYAEDRDFLPHAHAGYARFGLKALAKALESNAPAPPAGTDTWTNVAALFDGIRDGRGDWGLPAYGGTLFEDDPAISPAGAALAAIALPNAAFLPALRGLLLDVPDDLARPVGPVDFRSLRVREFGTIYEGLLESELAVAATDLALRGGAEYAPARPGETPRVRQGQTYLHNRSGARKSSGSYYTPGFAVDHLLDSALAPALDAHAARIRELAETDPFEAARVFFDFRVADIAMGSGHFLVAAMDRVEQSFSALLLELGDRVEGVRAELATLREAAERALRGGRDARDDDPPLPPITDQQLLRRQIARRCIYGVDLNPLAVELARLSIWIHGFVPGLPLSLLDPHLLPGNALVGVATLEDARTRLLAMTGVGLRLEPADMIADAMPHLDRLARLSDMTLADVEEARRAHAAALEAVAGAASVFDAAVAVGMGHVAFRVPANEAVARLDRTGQRIDLRGTPVHRRISETLAPARVLHLPIAFPEVFRRARSGFDVILGNPPWEKLRVEKHEFWARHFPGLRGLRDTAERDARIGRLERERPDLVAAETRERAESEALRDAVRALPGMNTGHPDLFRAFMARFAQLLCGDGGRYGVVLPGDAFKIRGNGAIREGLDHRAKGVDVQMLTNRTHWVFADVDVRKLVALVAVELGPQGDGGCTYTIRPEHHRENAFRARSLADHVTRPSAFLRRYSGGLVQPTLPTANAPATMAVIEAMMRVPTIGDHPRLKVRRVYADVETSRAYKAYYSKEDDPARWPVYGGDSFDLWQPDTGRYYDWANGDEIAALVQSKRARARQGTPYAGLPDPWRRDPAANPCRHPRIAYRDVTNRTNTRTLLAALIPPNRVLVQTAPWVLWTDPRRSVSHEAFLLGVMCSVPADWWMRRFVEGHVDEEAFDSLRVPDADPATGLGARAVALAARLAAPDARFAGWAAAAGVPHGPLAPDEKRAMIEELDAVVARLYGLTPAHLAHVYDTFHDHRSDDARAEWSARRDRTLAHLERLS